MKQTDTDGRVHGEWVQGKKALEDRGWKLETGVLGDMNHKTKEMAGPTDSLGAGAMT